MNIIVAALSFKGRIVSSPLVGEGQSYRKIIHGLGLSKNTVLDIVKRDRAA
jgi:transposase